VLSENYNLDHIRPNGSTARYCGLLNTVRLQIACKKSIYLMIPD
jgi:hypothetical protein